MNDRDTYSKLVCELLSGISEIYWGKMYKYITENNIDHKDVNCFILNPESMAVYFGTKFIAIEYCGNPYITDFQKTSQRQVFIRDFTKENLNTHDFIEKIVGYKSDGTSNFSLPLFSDVYEDLIVPTNAGMDKLIDLKWNFAAQSSTISLNSTGLDIADGEFVRLINCMFYDEQNGGFKNTNNKMDRFHSMPLY